MTRSRADHLVWCKSRALQILDAGDEQGAVASMINDLGKWEGPLYEPKIMQILAADGILFRKGEAQVRSWIEGFA